MKSWEPNKLIDDDGTAYQPTDKEGKRLAARLTIELRLIMHRARMTTINAPNFRCSTKLIK